MPSDNLNITDVRLLMLSPRDNVFIVREAIRDGELIQIDGNSIKVSGYIGLGHKLAAMGIRSGSKVLKYGAPIGSATSDIVIGDHVHVHNLKSDYTPTYVLEEEGQ